MIKSVDINGNMLTIEWDQEDYDLFFRAGLQMICDEHFKGKRKVVVVPHDGSIVTKKAKTVEVSDEFSLMCVEKAVNQAIREGLDRLESSSAKVAKVSKAPKKAKKTVKR